MVIDWRLILFCWTIASSRNKFPNYVFEWKLTFRFVDFIRMTNIVPKRITRKVKKLNLEFCSKIRSEIYKRYLWTEQNKMSHPSLVTWVWHTLGLFFYCHFLKSVSNCEIFWFKGVRFVRSYRLIKLCCSTSNYDIKFWQCFPFMSKEIFSNVL